MALKNQIINEWVKNVKEIKVDENKVITLKEAKALKKRNSKD